MSAAASDLQAAVRKTLTSRAFERFIGLAVENAMADAARADGAVQLLPNGPMSIRFADNCGGLFFYTKDGHDNRIHLFQRRAFEDKDGFYRNCHWYGTEARIDAYGHEWTRTINHLLVDDFGNLVEAPELCSSK